MTGIVQAPGRPGAFPRVRRWWGGHTLAQAGALLGVGLLCALLGSNTLATMNRLGINPGFGFLDRAAGFEIGETLIPYAAGDSYARALLVGLLNTVEVATVGCVLATTLGLALGIARLSGNLLLSGLVQVYVEVIRNTPLLLQLFFWAATLHALPVPRQALDLFGVGLLSNAACSFRASASTGWMGGSCSARQPWVRLRPSRCAACGPVWSMVPQSGSRSWRPASPLSG